MKRRFFYRIRLSRRQKKAILLRSGVALFILACIVLVYTYQIFPALSDSAKAYASNSVYEALNDSVLSFEEENPNRNYISVSYTENGKVSSIIADINGINLTRTKISKEILKKLRTGDARDVKLPVGCLLDSAFLYAKGPKLTFKAVDNNSFVSSVESEFQESGINQTLHRIYLVFSVNVKINLPLQSVSVPVKYKHLISETVIVGEIPDAYTNISRFFDDISESEIDDINDFGAY